MDKSGGCLCGAVRFDARRVPAVFGICHCPMCRRWTGSALVEVSVKTDDITWTGADHIATRATSDWAERAWCRDCGTTLYFRHTRRDAWFGTTDMAMGLFDDRSGFTLSYEIYVDEAHAALTLAHAGHKRLTRAQVQALNPDLETAP
jgi:hypothetical protein